MYFRSKENRTEWSWIGVRQMNVGFNQSKVEAFISIKEREREEKKKEEREEGTRGYCRSSKESFYQMMDMAAVQRVKKSESPDLQG